MNEQVWIVKCHEPGCTNTCTGIGSVWGMRALGWYFDPGSEEKDFSTMRCPFHVPLNIDAKGFAIEFQQLVKRTSVDRWARMMMNWEEYRRKSVEREEDDRRRRADFERREGVQSRSTPRMIPATPRQRSAVESLLDDI